METKVEKLEDGQVKVVVTVDEKDVADRLKKTYKDFANRYNFPGFRKGKAPRKIIDNAFGKDAIAASVTEDLINSCYPLSIDDARIYPMGNPTFGTDDALVKDGEPYTFDYTVAVMPEYTLSNYDNVSIELPSEKATEAEVEEQINGLLEHYATLENATATTKVKKDSKVDIAIKATDEEGEEITALTSEDRPYTLGSGLFPEAFDEQLIGLKKGQKAEFELPIDQNTTFMLSPYKGKTLKFEVEINAVKKEVLPKLTDEWVKEVLAFDTVDDFKKGVEDSISSQKEAMLPRIKETKCLEVLAERLEGEAPEAMVEETESNLLQDFFQQLQYQGMTLDQYLVMQGINQAQFKEDVKQQAQEMACQDLALDAWARHYGMEVTDEELTEQFAQTGVKDPIALQAEWRANGRLYVVRQGTLRTKAVLDVMEKANVTEVNEPSKEEGEEKPKKAAKKSKKKDEEATEE